MSRPLQALQGKRVIELGHAMAGPFAGQKLGDLGADVIKVEPPKGDFSRWQSIGNAFVKDQTTGFLSLNRNKRSLAVDLKTDEGQEVIKKLIEGADVILHNFRPQAIKRLGLDYERVRDWNKGIIFCSITGYGEEGPLADEPGQDLVTQGYSGGMWNIGTADDPPTANGVIIADVTAAHLAVQGILAAIIARYETGEGQKVEVNMLDGLLDMQTQELTTYWNTGITPVRTEEPLAHPLLNGPYGAFATKDGYMTVAHCPPHVLGEALDNDELRAMTRWIEGMERRDRIFRIVKERLVEKTTKEWMERFRAYNIWCGPVLRLDEIAAHEQLQANDSIWEFDHPTAGRVRVLGQPVRLGGTPAMVRLPPPLLGEHSRQIALELGFSQPVIAQLVEKGVLVEPNGEERAIG